MLPLLSVLQITLREAVWWYLWKWPQRRLPISAFPGLQEYPPQSYWPVVWYAGQFGSWWSGRKAPLLRFDMLHEATGGFLSEEKTGGIIFITIIRKNRKHPQNDAFSASEMKCGLWHCRRIRNNFLWIIFLSRGDETPRLFFRHPLLAILKLL